ncbi:MAG: hypothetical protein IJ667_01740 [Synergistaceae bacterium]|nr:hypothetical protein [Synergistaceae bacterium]
MPFGLTASGAVVHWLCSHCTRDNITQPRQSVKHGFGFGFGSEFVTGKGECVIGCCEK